jgi:uncharacterized protein (TIGR03492 family)
MTGQVRLLAVSNGHGEDDIAGKVLDALRSRRPDLDVTAWAMVGAGDSYTRRGIPLEGPQNRLPSEGFGTLTARGFWRDLQHGFVATHFRQFRHARGLRGRYDLLMGVGDIVPLAIASLSGIPMAFVACAKSAYYEGLDGHTPLERRIMRRHCLAVFPRDARTAEGFAARNVPCNYLGNPMMDGLGPTTEVWSLPTGAAAVLMLAGSRRDAEANLRLLLNALAEIEAIGLFPLAPSVALPPPPVGWTVAPASGAAQVWHHEGGASAQFAHGALGPMARAATVAVGLAGTANEQAIGLGLPLVTLPGEGNQGPAYVKMKMSYFGEAALAVPRSASAVAEAVTALLANPGRRAAMAAAGRARMGAPGASAAIAEAIAAHLPAPGQGQTNV